MALRSIDQRYWTDPYVESLSATEKLVYIHLFSSAHTNLVGVFQASRRMIAFQTACPGPDVDAALERFRRDGKAIIDGGEVWLASYIRHQCTSSPKMVAAMRGQLAKVESDTIRKAIVTRYPHIMEAPGPRPPVQRCLMADGSREPWRAWSEESAQTELASVCMEARTRTSKKDTVSVLSRYKREEKEKISAGAAPVEGAPAKQPETKPESGALVVSEEVARILKRDFPGVDYAGQLERARTWCAMRGQDIRNILLFLRKWFANAAKQADPVVGGSNMMPLPASRKPNGDKASSVPVGSKTSPTAPVVKPRLTPDPFRTPTADELEENARRGLEMLALWKQGRGAALA